MDNVDGPLVPGHDAPATFPIATTTVTFSATDGAGNTGTAQAAVTVEDQTDPVVTAPANLVLGSSSGALPDTNPTIAAWLAAATVLDNVLVAAHDQSSELSRSEAQSLLEQFGLADRLKHRPAELSAGERQRVAMSRAMLNRPKLLLADEPTGNLDPKNAAGVLDLLNQFHDDGGTVLLVTHDEKAAQRAARVIELEKGKLRAEPATSSS